MVVHPEEVAAVTDDGVFRTDSDDAGNQNG
jgi:hypothetical protein